jgi:endoglucanase
MLRRIYSALLGCCIFVPFCRAAGPTTGIKVDQAGYLPQSAKIACVGTLTSVPTARFFVRRSADHSIAFQGQLGERLFEADSGDYIQAVDFSPLQEDGRFYIDVPDVGRSWDFDIDPGVFRRVYYLAMRSYYGQRCGTAVDLGPEFPGYKHPACHLFGAYHPSSWKQGEHVSSRGWHDAGDYGRYVVNSGISTGTLLWA